MLDYIRLLICHCFSVCNTEQDVCILAWAFVRLLRVSGYAEPSSLLVTLSQFDVPMLTVRCANKRLEPLPPPRASCCRVGWFACLRPCRQLPL
ncbi:unnamed protein product [Haemonchus placei]|uniref:Secreted protein n=1 Tax=Haemonchus placei TaxID=6290 RepID=A0A0N4WNY1_HAEPC|nr:unnamed protein product [Haemonchus placei]